MHKIEWPLEVQEYGHQTTKMDELHEYSFTFLFDKFKDFYLGEIFPDFKKISIYEPDLGNASMLCGTVMRRTELAVCHDLLWKEFRIGSLV